jgi:uncharacterized protein (TIGR02246 family)
MTDETAIRHLQQQWFRATTAGDVETICDLMTDDVIFLTPGRPPFGKQAFVEAFNAAKDLFAMECNGTYEEVVVTGGFAYATSRLRITVTPKSGAASRHLTGNTLSIFRESSNGQWQLCRDANMLTPDTLK